ncbi:hypothetical protein ACIGFK_37230 [Streptomyces sp. NPDC085524]|uniref:hypothetical protein n=1 Tax=unclassified Streptomyces TaxID=2593676 RepID=UPI0035D86B03
MGEVFRLELTRNHLNAGDVMLALHRWQQFVRSPDLRMWDECDRGSVHWYCCGNPLEGRRLLDAVVQALSPRSARELRAVIDKSDALAVRSAATAALLLAPGPGNV